MTPTQAPDIAGLVAELRAVAATNREQFGDAAILDLLDKAAEALSTTSRSMEAGEGWKLVPLEPTEEQWGELARGIVFWDRTHPHDGAALHRHLKSLGREIPEWLAKEIPDTNQVPPKGTVAACIYKAMLAAAPIPTRPHDTEAT